MKKENCGAGGGELCLRCELTAGEWELAKLAAMGYSCLQMAVILNRSQLYLQQVFTRKIYEKTGTASRLELAVRFAWERKRGDYTDRHIHMDGLNLDRSNRLPDFQR